eukprot:SM000043S15844  [mRNA]  locus=s43:475243:477035:+ [translate_table: standard]
MHCEEAVCFSALVNCILLSRGGVMSPHTCCCAARPRYEREVLDPWGTPFVTAVLLLSSGAANHMGSPSILAGTKEQAIYGLLAAVVLAIPFQLSNMSKLLLTVEMVLMARRYRFSWLSPYIVCAKTWVTNRETSSFSSTLLAFVDLSKLMASMQRSEGTDVPLADRFGSMFQELKLPDTANLFIVLMALVLSLAWEVIPLNTEYIIICYLIFWAHMASYSFALRRLARTYVSPLALVESRVCPFGGMMIRRTNGVLRSFCWLDSYHHTDLCSFMQFYCKYGAAFLYPFADASEAEAEVVPGYDAEYSAMGVALFVLRRACNVPTYLWIVH